MWNTEEAELLLNALISYEKKLNLPAHDPYWILTNTKSIVAVAGKWAFKLPTKELSNEDKYFLLKEELEFGQYFSGSQKIPLDIKWISQKERMSVSENQGGIPVLLMKRLPEGRDFMTLGVKKILTMDMISELGRMMRQLQSQYADIPSDTALETWDFDKKDKFKYINLFETNCRHVIEKDYMSYLKTRILDYDECAFEELHKRAMGGGYKKIHGDADMANVWFLEEKPVLVDPLPRLVRRSTDPLVDVAHIVNECLRLHSDISWAKHFLKNYEYEATKSNNSILLFFMYKLLISDIVGLTQSEYNTPSLRIKLIRRNIFSSLEEFSSYLRKEEC